MLPLQTDSTEAAQEWELPALPMGTGLCTAVDSTQFSLLFLSLCLLTFSRAHNTAFSCLESTALPPSQVFFLLNTKIIPQEGVWCLFLCTLTQRKKGKG